MSSSVIIKQGAEGKLYLGEWNGQPCLIKERFPKTYRHPDLDNQLTKERIRAESRIIAKCSTAGILTPEIFKTDINERKIYMEYFDKAITVKEYINKYEDDENKVTRLASEIGKIIGKMHSKDIIHGDLTTSNMLLNPEGDNFDQYRIVMIDFGLSRFQSSSEEKGVDLYVLERALLSTHNSLPQLFAIILESYKTNNNKKPEDVILKYQDVRARGRKRTMVG